MQEQTIIECVRDYIAACPLLADINGHHIDWTEETPDNYGIFPNGDVPNGSTYIDGTEERQYRFSVYIRKMTDTDVSRLENSGFMEKLQKWFNNHSLVLPDDCDFREISAENAMLLELNETGAEGTYQVQCAIDYLYLGKD